MTELDNLRNGFCCPETMQSLSDCLYVIAYRSENGLGPSHDQDMVNPMDPSPSNKLRFWLEALWHVFDEVWWALRDS